MNTWRHQLTVLTIATALAIPAQSGAKPASPAPQTIKDCPNCPEVVAIAPGSFVMGIDPKREAERGTPANLSGMSWPLVKVTFAKGFAMGKYPITVAQFRDFADETGYKGSDSCFNQGWNNGHAIYEERRGYNWRSPGFPQGDDYPVVCVNYQDAAAYAEWLSKKTGHKYAVPNEAQYEYATRAGTTTDFFWGDVRDDGCAYSNQPDFDQGIAVGNAPMGPEYRFQCHDGYGWTSPVGHYKPNPWGLYDMLGNIWEWTSDCWNPDLKGAPTDGSTRTTGDCDARPSRGGSYGNAAFSTYSAIRVPRHTTYNGHSWGFRIVRND